MSLDNSEQRMPAGPGDEGKRSGDPGMQARLSSRVKQLELELQQAWAQLSNAQSQLEHADRLATLGALMAEVAHEIHTPLACIRSNNDTLERGFQKMLELIRSSQAAKEPASGREFEEVSALVAETIRTNGVACDRIRDIVGRLRRSARQDDGEYRFADIHAELDSCFALLGHEFKRRIRLVRDFGVASSVECRPAQIGQVFLNLLVNAAQAIKEEGEIRVRTRESGGEVRISISDTGVGIPQELLSKIFESGFTTKGADTGTGLGLSICRRIIQEHGGSINVESQVGQGATFTVVLPVRRINERNSND